jgi:hypothetical protein
MNLLKDLAEALAAFAAMLLPGGAAPEPQLPAAPAMMIFEEAAFPFEPGELGQPRVIIIPLDPEAEIQSILGERPDRPRMKARRALRQSGE